MNLNVDDFEKLLEDLGVHISSTTSKHFLCLCPFHDNTDSPSFEIAKDSGLWLCFNESCGARGNLNQLVERLGGDSGNLKQSIVKMQVERRHSVDIREEFNRIFAKKIEDTVDWDTTLETLQVNDDEVDKFQYLLDRGFLLHTLRQFELGFSEKKQRIVIPVRNENFKLVGLIGRAIDEDRKPKYLYTDNLPKKGLLFNLCYAKQYREVIIVEGSLDALRVSQAGFPNVVSTLGSGFSEQQADVVNRHFLDIVIFGDNDDAGRGLGEQIIDRCPKRNIYYARYPEDRKDPGEMTNEEIAWALSNKQSQIDRLFEGYFK